MLCHLRGSCKSLYKVAERCRAASYIYSLTLAPEIPLVTLDPLYHS